MKVKGLEREGYQTEKKRNRMVYDELGKEVGKIEEVTQPYALQLKVQKQEANKGMDFLQFMLLCIPLHSLPHLSGLLKLSMAAMSSSQQSYVKAFIHFILHRP